MATEPQHDAEPANGESAHTVAPGVLSGLLEELAYLPEVDIGGAPPPWPAAGDVIGRFELVREIGRGGFGVVYEAWDTELRRGIAFKLVRPGRMKSGEDQLRREAEVIAHLTHPNLVTLFDVGRCEHGPYLVLELLRGRTLKERLDAGRMAAAEAVRIAADIAKGLGHAHARGVVHRDLKPSNVFLCEGGPVKLLDFGMSRAFGRARVEGGTPAYMAPEQHRGAPEDERTDVYALGVMLYEMLAGELPFKSRDPKRGPPPARAAPALDVPDAPALAALVAGMIDPDPTRRPRDGAEVLAALAPIAAELDGEGAPSPARPVRKVHPHRRRVAAVASAGLLLAALLAFALLRPRPAPSPPRSRAIAVLPFTELSGAEADYFSDGLTEEILDRLTRLRELKVASSASSFSFRGRKVAVSDVARRLRVDVVLEGSVRREGDRLRIAAELVDGRSGFRIWSQIYDRRLEDVFAIQDDIAHRVVGALALVLSETSQGELAKPRAASLGSYDLYLRARAALRRPVSRQGLDEAIGLFEQAVAGDARFAAAHAGLCDAWLARYELSRAPESFERAETACRAALAHDEGAAEVYVALGNLHLASGDHGRAEGEFRRARALGGAPVDAALGLARTYAAQQKLAEAEEAFVEARELDPADWVVHQQLGHFLFRRGRHAEAAREYGEVIALTPDNASAHNNLGAAHYMAGAFDEAARDWRAALEISPTLGSYSNIGSSYFYLGRFEDAVAMFRKAVALAPDDHRLWGNLADAYARASGRRADADAAYAKAIALGEERLRVNGADAATISDLAVYSAALGRAERARRLTADALARDPQSSLVHYNAALVAARLGAADTALGALQRAVELGYPRQLLSHEPGLAALRNDPRFARLTAPRGE